METRKDINRRAQRARISAAYGTYLDRVGCTGPGPDHLAICAHYERELAEIDG